MYLSMADHLFSAHIFCFRVSRHQKNIPFSINIADWYNCIAIRKNLPVILCLLYSLLCNRHRYKFLKQARPDILVDRISVCLMLNETFACIFELYKDKSFKLLQNVLLNTKIDFIQGIFESHIMNDTVSSVY